MRRAAAWAVHGLTAAGGVTALLALQAVADGRRQHALAWLGVAIAIDAVDGSLARRLRVRHHLPEIDGGLLDNLVDFLNYVVIPAWLLLRSAALPPGWGFPACGAIVLAGALQFSHRAAKSDDGFFRGFPSYWNLVAFYLLLLAADPRINLAIVLGLAAASFAPWRFVYPTRARRLRGLTLGLALPWTGALVAMLLGFPSPPRWLIWASLAYPLYYVTLSIVLARGASPARPAILDRSEAARSRGAGGDT